MSTSPLAKKLRLKEGQRLLLLNEPEGYRAVLGDLPDGVAVDHDAQGTYEAVQVFARSRVELDQWLPRAIAAVAYDGLLWITYPKKSGGLDSDLSRDVIWELTGGSGWRPVAQVSVDETWSALRYRPDEKVGH